MAAQTLPLSVTLPRVIRQTGKRRGYATHEASVSSIAEAAGLSETTVEGELEHLVDDALLVKRSNGNYSHPRVLHFDLCEAAEAPDAKSWDLWSCAFREGHIVQRGLTEAEAVEAGEEYDRRAYLRTARPAVTDATYHDGGRNAAGEPVCYPDR